MKIGDLVELSAKGKSLKYCKAFHGMVGLIVALDHTREFGEKGWLYIDWCGGKKHQPHLRTDLKFVKR